MWKSITRKWYQYRYRFVPWLVVNLKHRTVRSVPKGYPDKLIPDETVKEVLQRFFTAIHDAGLHSQPRKQNNQAAYFSPLSKPSPTLYSRNLAVMFEELGFVTEIGPSKLPDGGRGVFVTNGTVKAGSVVSMYPGTVYQPYEPIFLASIGNPFVFRCLDGLLIDGNGKNLSKIIYRSCCNRDGIGPYPLGDSSWLTQYPLNPLAVGQYVNNESKSYRANVAYQEFDIPEDFPLHLRQFIPNIQLRGDNQGETSTHERFTRVVVLVSTRDIQENEELYSSYFTLVQ